MPRQMLELVEAGVQLQSNPKAQKSNNHQMMRGELQPATMVVHGEQQHQVVLGDLPWLLMITLTSQTMPEVAEKVEPASSVVKKATCQGNVQKAVVEVEVREYASNVVTLIIWQENAQLQMMSI